MVSRGQYLERPALVPVGDQVLEGLWHRGTRMPPVLVLPPPPEAGSMDHVVCAELAWASARAGRPVLRFNFRGVGASQGARGDLTARRADASAALRLLCENTGHPAAVVAAVGGSAELAVRLVAEHPGTLQGVVLVSPPVPLPGPVEVPLLVIVGEDEPDRAVLAAAAAGGRGRIEVVAAADARFQRHLPEVGRRALGWIDGVSKPSES